MSICRVFNLFVLKFERPPSAFTVILTIEKTTVQEYFQFVFMQTACVVGKLQPDISECWCYLQNKKKSFLITKYFGEYLAELITEHWIFMTKFLCDIDWPWTWPRTGLTDSSLMNFKCNTFDKLSSSIFTRASLLWVWIEMFVSFFDNYFRNISCSTV